ncbi:MAG TPA: helix-turn-helix transcriptional regulator [Chitinophagaceae bacterium]|nr:helix-turn-helix transcriptional regulator [Chitinophagaceae bacterium]
MKKMNKLPRILKIQTIKGFEIFCIFNNGETRVIDFARVFREWKIGKKDPEFRLLDELEFRKVKLRNNTLSWSNVGVELIDIHGRMVTHPYELSPDVVYEHSIPVDQPANRFYFGPIIREARMKKGLSQQELAERSGTSKTYISRIENNQIEPELSTLYKIVEIGLGRKIKVEIL